MATTDAHILIPMKVDCFVLNTAVCTPAAPTAAKIAPITQPNYTYLRYDSKYLANDILPPVELHATTSTARANSRITDLGNGKTKENRQGVYVHWTIPRPYRTGLTADKPKVEEKSAPSVGILPGATTTESKPKETPAAKDEYFKTPAFPDVPTRWLVVRHIDLASVKPEIAAKDKLVPELVGWIVESDHMQLIDELGENVDLQTDVSPYVNPGKSEQVTKDGKLVDKIDIDEQAEVFIGSIFPAEGWEEKQRPRATINLGQSSNQLFADFQPHNTNVFSMIDNLYYDGDKRITEATVNYLVVGWHSDAKSDPFQFKDGKRSARLDELNIVLKGLDSTDVKDWVDQSLPTRALCHGSKYEVKWSLNVAPNTPADESCYALTTKSSIAVGTTPLDSILAFVHDRADKGDPEMKLVVEKLHNIEVMLIARDEGVEPQQRAANMVGNANFKREEGGKYFYFADTPPPGVAADPQSSGEERVPTREELSIIKQFNGAQLKVDATQRLMKRVRWEMFSLWWIGQSDKTDSTSGRTVYDLQDLVKDLRSKFLSLEKALKSILLDKENAAYTGVFPDEMPDTTSPPDKDVKAIRKETFHKSKVGVSAPFYQPSDPTLLVTGVPSGWAHDYLDKLKARLDFQIAGGDQKSPLSENWPSFGKKICAKLPTEELQNAALFLLREFGTLRSTKVEVVAPKFAPLYHDQYPDASGKEESGIWRDNWNDKQPFSPLYFEWELDYVHIPFEFWDVHDTTIDPNKPSKLRYHVNVDRFLAARGGKRPNSEKKRHLWGRSLILPQPTFSLESKIKSLFSQLPQSTLLSLLDGAAQTALFNQIRQMQILSSPLDGFTDHLLTRLHGTHVKPNIKDGTGKSVPIMNALTSGPMIKDEPIFKTDDLMLISEESDLTPYGPLLQFMDESSYPFKPVVHGQIKFKKLNIIDRFGQVAHVFNPDIKATATYKPPIASEYYSAQRLFAEEDGKIRFDGYGFVQIPPQIGQSARLNASFVKPTFDGEMFFRPTSDWDNPVWGWVVINHANYGLQFFLPDGTFYREVRRGGPKGTLGSVEWLPYRPAPPGTPSANAEMRQLQLLVKKLSEDSTYLDAFASVIDDCMPTLLPTPPEYSSQLSAVVGRPLALVNMGWSLELASEPYRIQGLTDHRDPPRKLAEDDFATGKETDPDDYYSFKVKFGSREKAYDALIGYFPLLAKEKLKDTGDVLNLDQFYSYYGDFERTGFESIDKDLNDFYPYYLNPAKKGRDLNDLEVLRCKQLHIFGALMDPFASIHAFSSILPVKELRLPPWITRKVFPKMTTFFSIGPLLLQKEVPAADSAGQRRLEQKVDGSIEDKDLELGLPIPSSTLGTWNWLQPYPTAPSTSASTPKERNKGGSGLDITQRYYNRFKLDKVDQRIRFEPGPYTAVEGYLQLREPASKVS